MEALEEERRRHDEELQVLNGVCLAHRVLLLAALPGMPHAHLQRARVVRKWRCRS